MGIGGSAVVLKCEVIGSSPKIRMSPFLVPRYRFWAAIPELGGRYLRVVTLEDKVTIHNASPDRGFTP